MVNSFGCKKRNQLCWCPKLSWKCCEGRISEENPQNPEQPKTTNPARSLEVMQCWRMAELMHVGSRDLESVNSDFSKAQFHVLQGAGRRDQNNLLLFHPNPPTDPSPRVFEWLSAVRQKSNSWCEFSPALWASVRDLLLNKGLAPGASQTYHTAVTGSRSLILSFTCSHHSSLHELFTHCIHEHRQPLKNNLTGLICTAWPQHVSAHPGSQLVSVNYDSD